MTIDSKNPAAAESVLSRWSRRKQEAREQGAGDEVAPEDDVGNLADPPLDEPEEAPRQLTDADMPDIESLHEESDFSLFMSPGVSDELRNLALRKLFRAPVFNIRDGLDEYDEDYTSFEKLGDIVTCDMKHQVEMQEQKLREALEQEQQAAAETDDIEAMEEMEEIDGADAESDVETEPQRPVEVASAAPVDKPENTDGDHE